MSIKPFKNGKNVNKQFRSPFNTTTQNKNLNTPELNANKTPLRVSVSKRLIFQQTPPAKRLCLSEESSENEGKTEENKKLTQQDLIGLKQRIKEKQDYINDIKTKLLYKKKNKGEVLEKAIEKWTSACQMALKDYQDYLQESQGQPVSLTQILSSFGISRNIVNYSTDEDTFY